jgi:hypothetical protein
MTDIRQQAVVSLIIVVLSAVAAGATPPARPAVLLQYGVGTQLYAITSEGLVGQVTTRTGLKQGEWFSIEKGRLVPGTGDLNPAPVGYIKGLGEKIKYALFNGPGLAATTTIVGIRAGCIFGFYTDANYAGTLGFLSCPRVDLAYDYGYNGTFLTGMADDGLLVGFHDNPHLQYSGLIVSPSGDERDYVVPGADGTKILGLAPGGRIVGTFLKGGRWHGFVADINGDNLVVVNAKIRGKIAHDTGIVAIQGACTLGYFDVNSNVGQAGFVHCEGKHDIPFTFNSDFAMNPRGLLEDGTIFGDFDGTGPTEGFLLPNFVKP